METSGIFPIYLKKSYKFLAKNLHKPQKQKKKTDKATKPTEQLFPKKASYRR
jgi:hypothetical protein